jgi:light-regulated signal transduction histidine kinase (bacteriophytochrome)
MVTSYLQLLERRYKGQLDPDADDFIQFAVDGALRMRTLINDLLTYSRIGTRGHAFELTSCTTAVEQAIANLKVAIEESGAVITYPDLPYLQADPTQLIQLFQNLLSNAIKFRGEAPCRLRLPSAKWRMFGCFLSRIMALASTLSTLIRSLSSFSGSTTAATIRARALG